MTDLSHLKARVERANLASEGQDSGEPVEWQIRVKQLDGTWSKWFVTDRYTLADAKEYGRVLRGNRPIDGYAFAEVRPLYAAPLPTQTETDAHGQ